MTSKKEMLKIALHEYLEYLNASENVFSEAKALFKKHENNYYERQIFGIKKLTQEQERIEKEWSNK